MLFQRASSVMNNFLGSLDGFALKNWTCHNLQRFYGQEQWRKDSVSDNQVLWHEEFIVDNTYYLELAQKLTGNKYSLCIKGITQAHKIIPITVFATLFWTSCTFCMVFKSSPCTTYFNNLHTR